MAPPDFGSAFEPATADDWMSLVDDVLRGAPFEKKLVAQTAAGIEIQPLYDRDFERAAASANLPGFAPHTRGAEPVRPMASWDIRQRHNLIDPATTNAEILDDLEQGVTSILLRVFGEVDVADLRRALDGVYLDVAAVALDAGPWVDSADNALRQLFDEQGVDPSARMVARRTDPLGSHARYGIGGSSSIAMISGRADEIGPLRTLVGVDATPYVDAGADVVQEVAWSLATGLNYVRRLVDEHGWSVDQASAATEFTYAATADQFTTIAKLRAARRCWDRIVTASGGTESGQRQHAITSESMFTRCDPWVNLLRSSTACFAAAAGGAQSITVLPFDTAIGQTDEVGRRTARNIHLLLQQESHIGQVSDPAGGSWYIEDHTDQIAEKAWQEFQAIEANEGMFNSLTDGSIRSKLDATVAARRSRLSTRRDAVTGVSEFADMHEATLDRAPWPEVSIGLATFRPADEFEQLRDAARGVEPTVLLVNLGTAADYTARATFATNLLAAGGIGAIPSDGIDSAESASTLCALSDSDQGPRVAVICGTDEQYGRLVPDIAAALKAAGCAKVIMAGNPGDERSRFSTAGVDDFIHIGVDVIESLVSLHHTLGVAR